jgi:hypothetical protein
MQMRYGPALQKDMFGILDLCDELRSLGIINLHRILLQFAQDI